MNERIRELAEQAGIEWKQQPPHFTNTSNPINFPVSVNRDLERFAELIVRECAKVGGDFEYARLHDSLVEDHILKHFGVEE
jgi:hypothetical protein